jgi:hypothetical protein
MHGSLLVPRLARGGETCGSSWVACGALDRCKALASSYKNDILTNELYESKSNVEVLEISVHMWSKHVTVEKSPLVSISVLLVPCLKLIRSCHTARSFSMSASLRSGVGCNIFLGSLLVWMFDINTTNIVASECKTMTTFLDSLHKVQNTIKIIKQYVENLTVNWKGRLPQQNHGAHYGQPQSLGWLKASPTSFASLPSCVACTKKYVKFPHSLCRNKQFQIPTQSIM